MNREIRIKNPDSSRMPVLSIGHGSPMNAVLVMSAQWLTRGTFVIAAEHPEQIHDFYGFPEERYAAAYRPQGVPAAARCIAERIPVILASGEWGIDHAAWAVWVHLFPGTDASLSVPTNEHCFTMLAAAALHEKGESLRFVHEGIQHGTVSMRCFVVGEPE